MEQDPAGRGDTKSMAQTHGQGGDRAQELALVEAARAGDPVAARGLVRRYERAVFAQLRGVLAPAGRGALVEDLAQETFLRAFRALPRYIGDGRAKFSTWLLTIATRLALNELRRRSGREAALDTVDEWISDGVDATARTGLIGRKVVTAVGRLSAPLRAAFLLREIQGFEYAEIAEALEVDLGTVKSRLSRARAQLRAEIGEES